MNQMREARSSETSQKNALQRENSTVNPGSTSAQDLEVLSHQLLLWFVLAPGHACSMGSFWWQGLLFDHCHVRRDNLPEEAENQTDLEAEIFLSPSGPRQPFLQTAAALGSRERCSVLCLGKAQPRACPWKDGSSEKGWAQSHPCLLPKQNPCINPRQQQSPGRSHDLGTT